MTDGDLYIVGRSDDVIITTGKKLYPAQLEEVVGLHESLRSGNCAAIPDDEGRYVIIAERRRGNTISDLENMCRWIRRELSVQYGTGPSAVILVPPGSLPKTPSGKLQRRRLRALRDRGDLPIDVELKFGMN